MVHIAHPSHLDLDLKIIPLYWPSGSGGEDKHLKSLRQQLYQRQTKESFEQKISPEPSAQVS